MPSMRFALCAALAIGLAALTGEARAQEVKDGLPPDPPAHAREHAHPRAGDSGDHGHGTQPARAEAALRTVPERPRAGERTELTFTLADASGQPVRELITHHARKLHVFIISADMQVLGHIHPDDAGKAIEGGEAKVSFTFPRAGRYLVAADFLAEAGTQGVQFPIDVAGSDELTPVTGTAPATIRVVELAEHDDYADPILLQGSGKADGYAVSLQKPDAIKAGEPVALVYRFTKDGAPVTDLRPYFEAPLHLVVAKADLSVFRHEHGTVPEEGHPGHGGHGTGHEGHGAAADQGRVAFGPEVTVRLSFPEPGTYYLFSQAAHGARLLITRFPVEVR